MQTRFRPERSKNEELNELVRKRHHSTFIDGSHLKRLLTYLYATGPGRLITLDDLAEVRQRGLTGNEGIWLIRAKETFNDDEYGWVCINWPLLLWRLPHHYQAGPYLRSVGFSIREMQFRTLPELQGAYAQIEECKAALLQTLPPGSLLEADNPFFRQLVELYLPADQRSTYEEDPLSAHMQSWSCFRFGALSRSTEKSVESLLSSYSPLNPMSIGKVDGELLAQCPDIIRALVAVFDRARASGGKGWQKWGLAWVKGGLIFNHQLAMFSLEAEHDTFMRLFPSHNRGSSDLVGKWSETGYLQAKPFLKGLPPLGTIAANGKVAVDYAHKTTRPYKMLFQDTDPAIASNAPFHNSEQQVFFPIRRKDKDTLLTYFKQLVTLSQNKLAGEDVYNIDTRAINALPSPRSEKPDSHETFRVGFNAYNLGSTEEPPNEHVTVMPYTMNMVPYRSYHYFSYPDQLTNLLPVLNSPKLYDPKHDSHQFQWSLTEHGWHLHRLDARERNAKTKRVNSFHHALAYSDLGTPPVYKPKGALFLHPMLFGASNPIFELLDTCVSTYPEPNSPRHAQIINQVEVFKNFWGWIYTPSAGIKQGKYSEEFVYPLGLETSHCPEDLRLDTSVKRMQFIVDKALHANDDHVAFQLGKGSRNDPRSKKPNSYDNFIFWYAAHHEIAKLPWSLDQMEQAQYITKRWMPWRRVHSAKTHMSNPYPVQPKKFEHPHIEEVFMHANENFGKAFTQI